MNEYITTCSEIEDAWTAINQQFERSLQDWPDKTDETWLQAYSHHTELIGCFDKLKWFEQHQHTKKKNQSMVEVIKRINQLFTEIKSFVAWTIIN